jgi:hypothetical protein
MNRIPKAVKSVESMGRAFQGWSMPDGRSHLEVSEAVRVTFVDFYGNVTEEVVVQKQEINRMPAHLFDMISNIPRLP